MRDYIFNEANSRQCYASFATPRQFLRNWRSRRNFAKLHLLDDGQLKDMGLTRENLRHIQGLPLSADPVWELDRVQLLASRKAPG